MGERLSLVGLHVDEEERRGLALLLVGELAAQVGLEQRDRDEEHDAQPDGHHDPHGVAARAIEPREAMTPREPARARHPPGQPHQRSREPEEDGERGQRRAGENAAEPERSGLPDRQRSQAGDNRQGRGPRAACAPAALVDVAPENQRWRHGPDREQRPQRAEQRGEQAERDPARQSAGVPPGLEHEGSERGERPHEQRLRGHAEGGADEAPDERQRERLDQVRREEHARAGAETFEDRDRRQLAAEKRRDRRGDADAADQQARQPDEAEIGGELREESAKTGL